MTISKLARIGGSVELPVTDKIAADFEADFKRQNAAGVPPQYYTVKADKLLRAMRKTGKMLLSVREEEAGDNLNSAMFVLVADDAVVDQIYAAL